LALDQNNLTVRHVSVNWQEVFGLRKSGPLCATAAQLLGSSAEATSRDGLAEHGLTNHRPIPLSIPGSDAKRWHAVAHCERGIVFVELERADETAESSFNVLADVRESVARLFSRIIWKRAAKRSMRSCGAMKPHSLMSIFSTASAACPIYRVIRRAISPAIAPWLTWPDATWMPS
jgi:light-regulated signal transduction histidine kinase (bacteriophytochrome)